MNDVNEPTLVGNASASLGSRLRVARENAGLSAPELARRIGVMADSVVAWEEDDGVPRANRLQVLAGILNVSLRWLLDGRDDEPTDAGAATAPPIDVMHSELERLHATLGQARAMVEHSIDRLNELSDRAGPEKSVEH